MATLLTNSASRWTRSPGSGNFRVTSTSDGSASGERRTGSLTAKNDPGRRLSRAGSPCALPRRQGQCLKGRRLHPSAHLLLLHDGSIIATAWASSTGLIRPDILGALCAHFRRTRRSSTVDYRHSERAVHCMCWRITAIVHRTLVYTS